MQIGGETSGTPLSIMYVEGMNLSKGTKDILYIFLIKLLQQTSCGYQKEKLLCG